MNGNGNIQIKNMKTCGPIYFSQNEEEKIKFISLKLKFKTDFKKVDGSSFISTVENEIKNYTLAIKSPIHIYEYGKRLLDILHEISLVNMPAKIEIEALKGIDSLKSVFYTITYKNGNVKENIRFKKLEFLAKIGCFDFKKAQPLLISLELQLPNINGNLFDFDISHFFLDIKKFFDGAFYKTLECLTNSLVEYVEQRYCFVKIRVYVQKMSGISTYGIKIERKTIHYTKLNSVYLQDGKKHVAYLAVGTNLGDKMRNIHNALKMLPAFCRILDTSFLYSTKYKGKFECPHPDFLNCVLKIETELAPMDLLRAVKEIESDLHRVKSKDNDNRTIDLDIIFYDNRVFNSDLLVIPHPRMHLREFVLRPLSDINPYFIHPVFKISLLELLGRVISNINPELPKPYVLNELPFCEVKRVTAIGSNLFSWDKTHLMGILNITPDSFSDGNLYFNSIEKAVEHAKKMKDDGADVIDIGGVSTRPGADPVPGEEEYRRVIPVIEKLVEEIPNACLSIDTTNPCIAEKCLKLGVSLINNVSGLNLNVDLYKVAANYQVPIVLMHSRGTPKTMMNMAKTYDESNFSESIAAEMNDILDTALKSGVYRWNIILDPGIGFAKDGKQNIGLIKVFQKTSPFAEYPCLVGHSRKRFISEWSAVSESHFNNCDHHERVWGTIGLSSILAYKNVFMLRVHDVKENKLAVKMADIVKN